MTLVWSWRAVGESFHIQRSCWELEQPMGIDFNQNSRSYIVLKLLCDRHCYALSPHNDCFLLVMVYTFAMLVLHGSWLTPTYCWFLVFTFLPDVSVDNIHLVHHRSRQCITLKLQQNKCEAYIYLGF